MGLYVVGMHRSGTSAITEALAALPFDLPDAEQMVGGNDSNPRGHWEVLALTEFNQMLLERSGATWFAPTTEALNEMPRLSQPEIGLDSEALRVFGNAFQSTRWLFKDPRVSLTMPFWRHVLAPSPVVLVLRDPMAIARSLRARDQFSLPFALALWERYLRSVVESLHGMTVHVTTFAGVAAGGQPVIELVEFAAKSLDVAVPLDIEEQIHQVIDPSLRHHDGGPDTDHDLLTPEQLRLLAALHEAEGNHGEFQIDLSEIPETPGLDLVFESAAGFGHALTTLEEDLRTTFEEELDLTLGLTLGELDRLRSVGAAAEHANSAVKTELAAAYGALDQERIERLTAVHHSNLANNELDRLNRRRAVQWAMRAANGLHKLGAISSKPEPAIPATEDQPDTNKKPADFAAVVEAIDAGLFSRKLTIIIPVYNAVEAVQRCFESLRRFTPDEVGLIVVDDASPDERIAVVLDQIANRPNTTVVRNEENLGFTHSVNRGLDLAAEGVVGDVVILNSDTIVTPRWIQRLRTAAHEDLRYGTVTPLSNAAGVFSFSCPLPIGLDQAARTAALVAQGSRFLRPTGPTGNGFCLFVKAEALADVASLDAEAFPRGYGEENDFCMKLGALGWKHVVADDVAIFHEESASFGAKARTELIDAGLKVLDQRYPEYRSVAQEFVDSSEFEQARDNATRALADADPAVHIRSLIVSHDGGGGTDYHASDLLRALADEYEPLLLIPQGDDLVLWSADDPKQRVEIDRWTLSKPWDVRRFCDPEVAAVFVELLTRHSIEIVHIHHLIGHTFDLPRIAKSLGIPVAMTLHDFYMACPSVNLLDETNSFCGGTCTAGNGRCHTPVWLEPDIDLKHSFVNLWRSETRGVLAEVDALVTPSVNTLEHFERLFGDDVSGRIRAIEHGRDFDQPRAFARSPEDDQPISILLVGAINASKGAELAERIAAEGGPRNVHVELLGDVEPGYEGEIKAHGSYERDDLPVLLATLRPTFIGVFSIWAETHCYVVSEAWACGIPVLVGPLGAPAERVREHGGGVVVATLDPTQIVDEAVEAARDRVRYTELASQATVANVRTVEQMAGDYRALYVELLEATGGRTAP